MRWGRDLQPKRRAFEDMACSGRFWHAVGPTQGACEAGAVRGPELFRFATSDCLFVVRWSHAAVAPPSASWRHSSEHLA